MQLPDTYAWDEHDMLLTTEDEIAALRDRIIVQQVESLDLSDELDDTWVTRQTLATFR